jgi:hypothetical protein
MKIALLDIGYLSIFNGQNLDGHNYLLKLAPALWRRKKVGAKKRSMIRKTK